MSKGPGVWQRQILDGIKDGSVVVLTGPWNSHAEQNAIRRAAYALEARGLLRLVAWRVDGVPRLVAAPPSMDLEAGISVTGLDGKTYRQAARG